jgi:hypothetical protein
LADTCPGLVQDAQRILEASGDTSAYKAGVKCFKRWAKACGSEKVKLDELPISEITLVLWVTFQSRFLQAQTLQGYLYGIQHWSLTEANVDPLKNCKLLKKLIAKLTKTQRGPAPKRSVTLNVLRAIRPYFDLNIHDIGAYGL